MNILIAEDDLVSRTVLEKTLAGWGHRVVTTCDGRAAWRCLQSDDRPQLAILDWMMPEMDGPEVCRRLRALRCDDPVYLILLTARAQTLDIVEGLDSGADDYLTKPFNRLELQARIRVGERVMALQNSLAGRVQELEHALDQVKRLKGLLPICSYCKKIRDDRNYWQQVEEYVMTYTDAHFSHGICPGCWAVKVEPELLQLGVDPEKAKYQESHLAERGESR
ncbi:MAG: response regulator [Planctomycetota bacterium]